VVFFFIHSFFGFGIVPPPPPAGMGKHQDGGIKRGMAENLPFQSFIHILFLKFAFAGRRAANAGVR
ncbi:hypothetical protein, partial [Neisseria gonorrhoeae]|uniref:hypothetical protein n=1 Tax=Neisseria gonorrhoeae TaxID=485 RepID=UPI001609726A